MFSLFYNFVFRMYNVHVALLSDMKMAFLIVPFSLNLVQRNKNQCVGIFNSRKVVRLHGFICGIDFGLLRAAIILKNTKSFNLIIKAWMYVIG